MKQKSTYSIFVRLLLVALIFSIFSCEKDELDFNDPATETGTRADLDNSRRKVENPYTIPNMQKALDSLMARIQEGKLKSASNGKASISISTQITPNMLYIKFTPQSPEEEGLLQRDSTLALIDYPLGYEYEEAFFENRPPLKEGEIPAYYTTVAVDRQLPAGVPYEVLEEMYLPQEDESLENNGKVQLYKTAKGVTADFVSVLLHQAFKQTGNEGLDGLGILKKDKAQAQNKGIFGDKWLPRGTLRIWDDNIGSTITTRRIFIGYQYYDCNRYGNASKNLGTNKVPPIEKCKRPMYRYEKDTTAGSYVPLVGAQVLLRATFTIGNEITNSEGYFQFDHKRGRKRYIIQWERYHYSIRDGALFQAELRGPKQDSRWDYDIKGGEDEYHGTIHRAAHNYFYGDIDGLRRPPRWDNQVKIAAYTVLGKNYHTILTSWIPGQPWPRISIKSYGRSSDAIFGTVTHELSHATHADGASPIANFIGAEKRMRETYAQTIEWYLTTKYYRNYDSNYVFEDNYQDRAPALGGSFTTYTSLMVDLMDMENQRSRGSIFPIDRVEDYTINQIEREVMDNKTFYSLKNALKSNYFNGTENYLDELFNNWN